MLQIYKKMFEKSDFGFFELNTSIAYKNNENNQQVNRKLFIIPINNIIKL